MIRVVALVWVILNIPHFTTLAQNTDNPLLESCPQPVLSRLERHTTVKGETLSSIAQQYNLVVETLLSLNPHLAEKPLSAGTIVLIPPYNGIQVNVPVGATWQDLSSAYGVRPDILFELNGCQNPTNIVFIPGVDWNSQGQSKPNRNYTGLSGYPLPFIAKIGLSYGWYFDQTTQRNIFHSGVDLLAEVGTPVLAPESGQVVFKGDEGSYGFLVIVEHRQGQQTRYAHLSKVIVEIGQAVETGDILGYVGTSGQPDIADPHLHFEVRYQLPVGWVAQDPMIHLSQSSP